MGLPAAIADLLREQRRAQEKWRHAARQLWHDDQYVFTSLLDAPLPKLGLSPMESLAQTCRGLDGRLHDAQHTAATVLLILVFPNGQ